jgi:hypothetical protein
VLAFPLTYGIINNYPVKQLLSSLPSIDQQELASPPPGQQEPDSQNASEFIILILMIGTLGGAVSLVTRLQDFDNPKNQKYDDDLLPLFIGLTKPILGGSFAFFILLILNSGISPLEIRGRSDNNGNGIYLYGLLAMAFVTGFSERLVPDLISKVEKQVTVVDLGSTGQGLPSSSSQATTISIDPSNATLALSGSQEFTIAPVGNYTITIEPANMGTIDQTTTTEKFSYTAPSTGNNGETITITATSDSTQTATATVTLTA